MQEIDHRMNQKRNHHIPANAPQSQHIMKRGQYDHHEHINEDFHKRFWICLAPTVPILLLSHRIQVGLSGMSQYKKLLIVYAIVLAALVKETVFFGGILANG
jgi:hypothetical protein